MLMIQKPTNIDPESIRELESESSSGQDRELESKSSSSQDRGLEARSSSRTKAVEIPLVRILAEIVEKLIYYGSPTEYFLLCLEQGPSTIKGMVIIYEKVGFAMLTL